MPRRPQAPAGGCVLCGGPVGDAFWEARGLPVFCNVLCATREEAIAAARADIRLTYCPACALITNSAFDPARLVYNVRYENSLDHSPRFQRYAAELAHRLVDRYGLHHKTIVEIACGQGDFLRMLCAAGGNIGLGFDPSYVPKETTIPGMKRVTFVQDYYSPRYADRRADFVCCRHALEHIADPVAFLSDVRRTLADQDHAVVFFEVPDALWTLRELGIWDLIYEHCTYFVGPALRRCFAAAGFEPIATHGEYDGQFLTIEARPGMNGALTVADECDRAEREAITADVRRFAEAYTAKVAAWRDGLAQLRATHKRAVVWGSGSKGVTFLNVLAAENTIEYVVDINPRKQGMFVAGTGQRIVAPDFLRAYRPDVVVVMNPIYVSEIQQALTELGLAAEVQVA